jgi:CheY-like chemotaxis protein
LLAEDHQVNASLMIEGLEHLGAEVMHALDGEAVCRIVMQGSAFDVILMDCQMPNVDGFEASRRIRAWEGEHGKPSVPIIAMTGLSHEFEHDHSSQVGMNHYVVKPVHMDTLAATILVLASSPHAGRHS